MTKYPTKLKNYLMAEITRYALGISGFTISDPLLQDAIDKSYKLQKDLIKSGMTVEEMLEIQNKYLRKIDELIKNWHF